MASLKEQKLKLTPIKFDAQYPDGVLELEGKAFEWNGMQFAVHRKRPIYDWPGESLCVSSVETGFGCGGVSAIRSYEKAAKEAIARFDKLGIEKVREAMERAKAMKKCSDRLTA